MRRYQWDHPIRGKEDGVRGEDDDDEEEVEEEEEVK